MAALHKRHTHGRVFRGEEARELLMIRKRDSHDDRIRMHVPDGFDQQQSQPQAASVVYVTLPQTFSGPAVYSTLTGPYTPDASAPAKTTPVDGNPNWYTGAAPTSTPPSDDRGDDAATAGPESTQQAQMTTFATATSTGPNRLGGTPIQATSAATSAPAASPASSDGMSGGAKAGLAFGIIAILALAAGLVFLCWKRKRPSKTDAAMNEKHGSFADVGARRAEANGMSSGAMAAGGAAVGGAAAAVVNKRDSSMTEKYPESVHSNRSVSTAPRLSLRPVTQFLPMLGDKNNGPAANSGSDPFADGSSLSEKNARGVGAPANPFDEQRKSNDSINAASAAVAGAAAAAGVAAGHGRTGSGSETPRSGQSGGPGAPGAPGQPNNVHRVQLDFKPSMDDELELVSGALVRLLHEYDDGWALCITMDRSKQGVAPRTCLSKLPVKPRPQGPPPNQGSRPSTPNGQMRGPPPPNGTPRGPPRGPMGPPSAMQPRPLTPQSGRAPSLNDQRPMTPRSNGTNSPTAGTQVPTRKPVPGQAM